MICPVCGKETSFRVTSCENCGQDIKIYKKIISASNMYYNEGLEKAKVRDLSGAVHSLKKSLRFYKRNTKARNLLGLVFYEMGEVVEALSEWVLSKNFQSEGNDADRFIEAVQKNASGLEAINQTIKKFNLALHYAQQGNEDLAVMQLEKVITLNPRFIRSYQLLSLLYMKAGDNKKAAKCLLKAKKIDRNNTLTLKYLQEIPDSFLKNSNKIERESARTLPEADIKPDVFKQGSYKEERFNFWPYVNLLIGAILGILVVYALVVPTAKKNVASEYEEQFKSYSDELAAQSVASKQLANEKESLSEQLKQLETELKKLKDESKDEKVYSGFYKAIQYYMEEDLEKSANELANVKESELEDSSAKKIYKLIKEETFKEAAEEAAEEGRIVYNSGKYDEAIELLEKALTMDSSNVKAIYFLGRAYHRKGEYEKAREYYETIINDYSESDRVLDSTRRLNELPKE